MLDVATKPHIEFDNVTVRFGAKCTAEYLPPNPTAKSSGINRPGQSGKTTFLKCINRMIDFIPGAHVDGR